MLDGGDVTAAVEAIKNDNLALQAEMGGDPGGGGGALPQPGAAVHLSRLRRHRVCGGEDLRLSAHAAQGGVMPAAQPDDGHEADHLRGDGSRLLPRHARSGNGGDAPQADGAGTGVLPQYAANFAPGADNLLLRGPTGVGKTHASLAIARQAAEKGHAVIYGPHDCP